jgi:glutathione S-transferase
LGRLSFSVRPFRRSPQQVRYNTTMTLPQVHLYSVAVCPFAQRTRIMLALKGMHFKLTEVDLTRPRPAWFLALNPLGQVPVIVHGEHALNESSVINEYLEEVFPNPSTFPEDPYVKARVRILVDYCNNTFVPALYRLLITQQREQWPDLREKARATWRWINDYLLDHATGNTYFTDKFGVAELTFAPFFQRYILDEYYRYFDLPATEEYQRARVWRDAVVRHPLVRQTGMPDDDFIKLYEDYAYGCGDGAAPPGKSRSSLDLTVPLCERPMPQRPAPEWSFESKNGSRN